MVLLYAADHLSDVDRSKLHPGDCVGDILRRKRESVIKRFQSENPGFRIFPDFFQSEPGQFQVDSGNINLLRIVGGDSKYTHTTFKFINQKVRKGQQKSNTRT